MNRNRLVVIGLIALVIAALLTMGALRTVKSMTPAARPMATVVVAAVDLGVGAQLNERDLRTVEYPANDLPAGVFHTIPELVGRGVVLPIGRNEPVLARKLAQDKAGAGLPSLIPQGMRAVSVRVNEVISVAGFVAPGTRVDVLLTGNPVQGNPADTMTTTILENVEVLAAGQKLERDEQGKAQTVTVITLQVSPEDAQKLTLAASEGKIQLGLRNPLDVEQRKPLAVRNIALYHALAPLPELRKSAKAGPRKVAPPVSTTWVVERILGDKRDEAKF
jgi:pilus assembly protein CpaB